MNLAPPNSGSGGGAVLSTGVRQSFPADDTDASAWVDILTHRPTLATFETRFTFKGFGHKRGPTARNWFNWSKRFLLVQEPFLLYFNNNDPLTPCLGVAYLPGATVTPVPFYPDRARKHVIRLAPLVRRNLRRVAINEDEDNFYLDFDTSKERDKWIAVFRSAARGSSAAGGDNGVAEDAPLHHAMATLSDSGSSAGDANATILDTSSTGLAMQEDAVITAQELSSKAGQRDGAGKGTGSSTTAAAVDVRRKSFFNPRDVLQCRNSDEVHQTSCTTCGLSPIFGFAYQCLVCDECTLCASCFREADHSLRHAFDVTPFVDGEPFRIGPSMEGSQRVFRTVELVAFEALFRSIDGTAPGSSTKPIPKRRLVLWWTKSREVQGPHAMQPLTEKLLLQVCRNPSTVEFDEFMMLVRWLVMDSRVSYADVLAAFDTMALAVEAIHQGGTAGGSPRQTVPASSVMGGDEAASEADHILRRLERSALHVFLGCASADGSTIGFHSFIAVVGRIAAITTGVDSISEEELAELVPFSGGPETIDDVMGQISILVERGKPVLDALPAAHHKILEAVDVALLYDSREGLGMYTPQLETLHPAFCDGCGISPIIGFRYHCTVREDFDLCARCFHTPGVAAGSQFIKNPGGLVLDAPNPSRAKPPQKVHPVPQEVSPIHSENIERMESLDLDGTFTDFSL